MKPISVSEDFIYSAETVDRDRLVHGQMRLEKVKRAHAKEREEGCATIGNRRLLLPGTIARPIDRRSRWRWHSR